MAMSKGQAKGVGHSHGPHGHGGVHHIAGPVHGSNGPHNNPFTESSGHTVHDFGGGSIQGE